MAKSKPMPMKGKPPYPMPMKKGAKKGQKS